MRHTDQPSPFLCPGGKGMTNSKARMTKEIQSPKRKGEACDIPMGEVMRFFDIWTLSLI